MESVEFSLARQHQGGFFDDGNDDVAWAVEKGSFFGDEEFLVDDLLDLGELETEGDEEQEEKEVENQEDEEEEKQEEEEEEEEAVAMREENKSCSSALTFETPHPFPPPVSDFTLPAQDDVAALEWVSRVVDDSFSEILTCETHHQLQPQAMAQAPPPPLPPAVPVKARRSKRARTLSGSSWSSSSYSSWDEGGLLVFLDSSASSSTTTAAAASSATSSSSSPSSSPSQLIFAHQLLDEIPLHPSPPPPPKSLVLDNKKPKKRGWKPKAASCHGITATAAANNGGGGERRCSHCGVNKTPQWRTGPMGAKTLCNACGVRYKSGRLLPEYRPACSPTFISHVHSNSHRKVLEMRRKEAEKMEKRQQHRQNLLLISSATPVASF